MWHEHRRMEGAIKIRCGRRRGHEREQSPVSCMPYLGERAIILQGTLFVPLRPLPRVPAVTLPVYSYAGSLSMLKQPESAFEMLLYFLL